MLLEGGPLVHLWVPAEPEVFVLVFVPDLCDVVGCADLFGRDVLPPLRFGLQEVLLCGTFFVVHCFLRWLCRKEVLAVSLVICGSEGWRGEGHALAVFG